MHVCAARERSNLKLKFRGFIHANIHLPASTELNTSGAARTLVASRNNELNDIQAESSSSPEVSEIRKPKDSEAIGIEV